jgi:hypothetical protein
MINFHSKVSILRPQVVVMIIGATVFGPGPEGRCQKTAGPWEITRYLNQQRGIDYCISYNCTYRKIDR